MTSRTFSLKGNRTLTLSELKVPAAGEVAPPFVTLLPAYSEAERRKAEAIATAMIDLRLGCIQLTCVGPESELLHDTLDEIIVQRAKLGIVTTWDVLPAEAAFYFVHGALAEEFNLLAMVSAHSDLEAMLEMEAKREPFQQ